MRRIRALEAVEAGSGAFHVIRNGSGKRRTVEEVLMKRDMDLVREILLAVEESQQMGGLVDLDLPGRSDEEVAYHVLLLHEAGLLEASNFSDHDSMDWRPSRLTWHGHEFLDAAREETRWAQAKSMMMEKAGGLSFVVLRELLLQLMRGSVLG